MVVSQAPTLPLAEPASLGLDPERIERLCRFIEGQIAEGYYPGAQIAFARNGKLAFFRASAGRGWSRRPSWRPTRRSG
jgi:hypothetical protein